MVGDQSELYLCNDRGDEMEAYERLIGDAMKGDATLFARQDSVEQAWRIVDPILDLSTNVHEYAPDTWGPVVADKLIARLGGWHSPAPAT
jgi:glucose-6-phosphate 1-dehydrogenase